MTYDREKGLITANGRVEVSHEGRVMLADTVSYNQKTDVLTAAGNVSIMEPTGEVIFGSRMEVTGDLKDGVIEDLGLILSDSSRFAASGARRSGAEILELRNAVYSPCNLCKEDPTRPPLWQIRAVKVVHDQRRKIVEYADAQLEVFGFPVAYTPYFAHPDPTVKRRSGFLVPSAGGSSDLGTVIQAPYFFNIAPNVDVTATPILTTSEGPAIALEYRHLLPNGRLEFKGSITQDSENDARGHTATRGRFDIDDTWRWGFDANRAIDDTYTRRYGFESDKTQVLAGSDNSLVTQIFAEGFRRRNYFSARAYTFQGLQQGDDFGDTPNIFPLIDYNHVGQPGRWGGRTVLDTNLLALTRTDGADTRRLSIRGGWELPGITSWGSAVKFSAKMNGDFYHAQSLSRASETKKFTGFSGRLIPELALDWRHPFARNEGRSTQMIEPIVSFVASPYGGNSNKIPNEDSLDFELDDTNIFSASRFTGLDRVEGGPRFNYGIRWGSFGHRIGSATVMVGQSYRIRTDDTFAKGSGLEDHFSDPVAKVHVTVAKLFDLLYRTRFSKENYEPKRNEIGFSAGVPAFRVDTNYAFLDRQEDDEFSGREEVRVSLSSQFDRYWRGNFAAVRDLTGNGQMRSVSLALIYENECCAFTTTASRSFFEDRDLEPSDSIVFRVLLKTLGEVKTGISRDQ